MARRMPTGRVIERTKAERDPTKVVMAYRQRVHSLNADQAKHVKAATALGRMAFHAPLTEEQWEAGEWYREIRIAERRALLVRHIASAGDLERMGGYDARDGTDPAYIESVQRALERGETCRRALLECGEALAQMVLEAVVMEDKEMLPFSGELRCALNAIARVRDNLRSDAKYA